MHLIDIEVCSNCGRDIARSEQAYVFEGKIVCAECDSALRTSQVAEPAEIPEPPAAPQPTTTIEPQFEESDLSKPEEQEKEKQYPKEEKHPGFIIAGVTLLLIGAALIHISMAGLVVSFLAGILIGIFLAGWFLILGIVILISGITAIVISFISR
jgi:hypothetical protein